MFNHRDTLLTSSWQVQLVGAKKCHVCAPSQEPYLYQAGGEQLKAPSPHDPYLHSLSLPNSLVSRLSYDSHLSLPNNVILDSLFHFPPPSVSVSVSVRSVCVCSL